MGIVTIPQAKKNFKEKHSKLDKYLCFCKLFFHWYECQGIQTKNPFDTILSLSFDLGPLNMNIYGIIQESIFQRIIKRTHIIQHIRWEKNK
jgi:hypothetical protein